MQYVIVAGELFATYSGRNAATFFPPIDVADVSFDG